MNSWQIQDNPSRVDRVLDRRLPADTGGEARLHEAMRYSVLGGGKRIRARLVYATAETLGLAPETVDGLAAAVECIHAYSLVHDDLPAMDDDALRRGKPTLHLAFDEATAILAGDALQAQAFEIVATDAALGASAAEVTAILARACGARGMVAGQALDMASEGRQIGIEALERLHNLKTGALLAACTAMPAACAPALTPAQRAALDGFGARIGLAFQVRDDVLDIESSTETLGKTQGADVAHDKATYPAVLGLDGAREHAERLYTEALEALDVFGEAAAPLRAIAAEIVKRDH